MTNGPRYVMGLLFDQAASAVLLIHKNRGPAYVVDRWNGIGGKIEAGESSLQAMARECAEETGLVDIAWRERGTLWLHEGGAVHVFVARDDRLREARQMEDESIGVFGLDRLPQVVPGLRWQIPLVLDRDVEIFDTYHEGSLEGVQPPRLLPYDTGTPIRHVPGELEDGA